MPLSCIFDPAARQEFHDAVDYYAAHGAQSATRLVDAVEAAVLHLCEYPDAWPRVEGGLRRCPVEGYPYWLLYSHTAERATIMVVCHSSREPEYWRERVARR